MDSGAKVIPDFQGHYKTKEGTLGIGEGRLIPIIEIDNQRIIEKMGISNFEYWEQLRLFPEQA